MDEVSNFSNIVQDEIKNYVYCLIDPRDNKIFYVGRGVNNRVFAHEREEVVEKEKNKLIDDIKKSDKVVKKYIIVHGLTEEEAKIVETAIIDLLSLKELKSRDLTNLCRGYNSSEYGVMTVEEIERKYSYPKIMLEDFKHRCLIVNINGTYDKEKDNKYEATRGNWRISEDKKDKVELVISEYKGAFIAVFKPNRWYKSVNEPDRWEFDGEEVSNEYQQYIKKRNGFKKIGEANPIRYTF